MLKLLPDVPWAPSQFSITTHPFRIFSIRLVPTWVPSGVVTTQSPTQKSNCEYSSPEQGAAPEPTSAMATGVPNVSRAMSTSPFRVVLLMCVSSPFPPRATPGRMSVSRESGPPVDPVAVLLPALSESCPFYGRGGCAEGATECGAEVAVTRVAEIVGQAREVAAAVQEPLQGDPEAKPITIGVQGRAHH